MAFMSWLRASFASIILLMPAVCARAADFKAQHQDAVAANPAGVHLTISLRDGKQRFHMGERITVDYALTADASGKYLAGARITDESGRSTLEQFVTDRPEDAGDPVRGFFDLYSALYCPTSVQITSGNRPLLPSAPLEDSLSVTQYLSFRRPGHYRLYAVTRQVISTDFKPAAFSNRGFRRSVDDTSLYRSRPDYGGPPVASENIVEFDILPQDKKAAAEEIEAIVGRTKRNNDVLDSADALRLFEIGTPQARQTAARLYSSNVEEYPHQNTPSSAVNALLAAPARAEAIQFLQQRLSDPEKPPDYEAYFDLPVLRLLEENPGLTGDEVRHGGLVHGDHLRDLLVASIAAEHRALMASLDKRSPQVRALTIRFLSMNSTHKACTIPVSLPAEDLARLKEMRLNALPDLPQHEQSYELANLHYWAKDIPKEQLLPALNKLFDALPKDADQDRVYILADMGRWDPESAGKLFRRRVVESEWTPELSNFIPELWSSAFSGPELDEYFVKVFQQAHTDEMERMAPLLARFGTRGVIADMKRIYEVAKTEWPCSLQAGLLTYFMRVDLEYGTAQTAAALEESYKKEVLPCRENSLLVTMALLRKTMDLDPLTIAAVHDRRPLVAASGVRAVGILFARELPYDLLLERLRQLHEEWPDYPVHAKDEAYVHRWQSGYDQLERMIVQLLTNTTSRQLLPIQKDALEACISDDCRTRLGMRVREAAQYGIKTSQ